MARTLNDLLERAAAFPETGLRLLDRHEGERWLPWHEVRDGARAVAGGLQGLGIAPGEPVALIFPTGQEFFDAFFGILLAGAVPVPLYPPVRLGRLTEYLKRTAAMLALTRARLVLADRRVEQLLGEAVAEARLSLGCCRLSRLPRGEPHPVATDASKLALVQFSSGTTVDPKPVALSHRAILAQVVALNRLWPDSDTTHHSGVSWLPLYHDMGLIGCVFPALERPGVLTLLPPEAFITEPALWLRAISRYRATISPAPNFAYSLCNHKVREGDLDGVDLSCWHLALNGAEAVTAPVLRAFQRKFARWGLRPEALTPVYGLSEAALAVTFSDLGRPFTSHRFCRSELGSCRQARLDPTGLELVSLGRPLPGFELRIRNEAGHDLPAGCVGQVWVRGPSLMEGYLEQPAETAEAVQDGWLDTGDRGFLFHGELYLTGRAKDLIILRGRNYSPEEIETALSHLPGARPGCAVAASWLPEGSDGEILGLFVEQRRRANPSEAVTLPAACTEAVLAATGLRPDRIVVLPPGTLPRTSSGKLRRRETVRRYLAGKLEPPAPVHAVRLVGALARSGRAYARWRWERRG